MIISGIADSHINMCILIKLFGFSAITYNIYCYNVRKIGHYAHPFFIINNQDLRPAHIFPQCRFLLLFQHL